MARAFLGPLVAFVLIPPLPCLSSAGEDAARGLLRSEEVMLYRLRRARLPTREDEEEEATPFLASERVICFIDCPLRMKCE